MLFLLLFNLLSFSRFKVVFFFNQLIYITNRENYTISIGLTALNKSYGHTSSIMPTLMAGAFIVTIPVLIVYYFGQRAMMNSYVFRDTGK